MAAKFKSISVSRADQGAREHALRLLRTLFWSGRVVFDPCPTAPKFDGLEIPWKRVNFVNPPYDSVSEWAEKAIREAAIGDKTSVFLVPFRTKSRYTHHTVMRNATQIIIWMNRFKFVGYENPIPATIATYVFGKGVPRARSTPDVSFHPIRLHSWELTERQESRADLHRSLMRHIKDTFGVSPTRRIQTQGPSFVIVTKNNQEEIERAVRHCRSHSDATVAVMMYSNFHTQYMRAARNNIKDVIMIAPALSFTENFSDQSNAGTVVLVVGKRMHISKTHVTANLAIWKQGEHFA